ncbi:MAG: hypothetical protein ABSE07_11475 [Methanoregula sp.]
MYSFDRSSRIRKEYAGRLGADGIAESSHASLEDFVKIAGVWGELVIQVEDLAVTPCAATGEYEGFWIEG